MREDCYGGARNLATLATFTTVVTLLKDLHGINDNQALLESPLLITGDAHLL